MPLGRVLVVEDEPQVADMLAAALTSLGYESQSASNGPDALRLAPLYQPDVVLLDVLMPGMPGTEVLDALRRDYPDVPVVMVTAMQDEDNPANVRLRRAPSRPAPWGSIAHGVGRAAGSHRRARRPDLIFLDLHLPDMEGEDVLRARAYLLDANLSPGGGAV